jgi:nicotinamide riboside transporter PnuC
MIENLMWIVTGASVVGTVLNIKKKRICFFIWFVTNSLWCIYDFAVGSYAQSALFLVYVVLAVWGIISWKRGES